MRALARVSSGIVALAVAAALDACSAAGSEYDVHGPSYDLDAIAPDDAGGAADTAPGDGAMLSSDGRALDATLEDASTNEDAPSSSDTGTPVASDDGGDGATSDGGCASTRAILAGGTGATFGVAAVGTGTFVAQNIAGSLTTAPALVPFGGGFQGLATIGGAALSSIRLTGTTWSSPSALGGSASAIDGPAIAPVGTTLQAVYLNPSHLYFHASFSGSWDTVADPVEPPGSDSSAQAFGPVRAVAAGTATQLVIAYEGSNSLPYAQTWTSDAGWDDGVALASSPVALTPNTPLAMAPLGGGGESDLVAVYVDGEGSSSANNLHLYAVLRNAGTTTWASPVEVGASIFTPGGAAAAPSLTSLSGGGVLLGWVGQMGGVYTSVYTPGTGWSTAAQLTSATVAGPPSLAPGVCGDDAEAAYVSGGSVYTSRFTGGAWSAPALVAGVAGAAYATMATYP
jgi:hypothetical protein